MGAEDINLILRKLDDMQEQRYENGLAAKELEGRVVATEVFVTDQKENNKENIKYWRKLNQKMWLYIVGGAIGLIFLMLKDLLI